MYIIKKTQAKSQSVSAARSLESSKSYLNLFLALSSNIYLKKFLPGLLSVRVEYDCKQVDWNSFKRLSGDEAVSASQSGSAPSSELSKNPSPRRRREQLQMLLVRHTSCNDPVRSPELILTHTHTHKKKISLKQSCEPHEQNKSSGFIFTVKYMTHGENDKVQAQILKGIKLEWL